MPKTVEVVLNESTFTIGELRSRENAAWRRKLEEPFKELAGMLERAPDTELTDLQSIAQLVRTVGSTLLESIDMVKGLLIAYAPNLESVIEDAYDSEILAAFEKVLGLAYPFGGLIQRLKALGSESNRTTRSSPGQSGASGTTG
jgi:hypothetical protein